MAGKEYAIGGTKYVVSGPIGKGGSSYVVKASAEGGMVVALRIFGEVEAAEAASMSDKITKEAGMMMDWESPWVVKGLGCSCQ
jgi:hypothetical protein